MTDSIYNPYYAFVTATSDRADLHFGTTATEPSYWRMGVEDYIKEGWFVFPEEWKKYLDVDYSVHYEGMAEVTDYCENIKTLTDLTGLCWFCAGFWPFPFLKLGVIAKLISYAIGTDIDETEVTKIARRIRTLIQASNVRLGIKRKDDTVPEKFFCEEPTPRQKEWGLMKLDHNEFDKQLDRLYNIRGWNSDAIPCKKTLDGLDLDYIRQDLEQRGLL